MRVRVRPVGAVALLAAGATTLLTLWNWGGLSQPPSWHDEAAYLLQANIFSTMRWSLPTPTHVALFEQYHVLLQPGIAAKYPPGQALALVPGAAMGAPAAIPLVLTAFTAWTLIFVAGRRFGLLVGLVAWGIWLLSPLAIHLRPSYLSEVTTGALWMVGTGLVWQGLRQKRLGVLIGVLACVGLMAITRPLTALAFALPIPFSLWGIWRGERRKPILVAGAMIVAVASMIAIWSHQTTGDWSTTPLALYTEQYMPWDQIGWAHASAQPVLAGPPDMTEFTQDFLPLHLNFGPKNAFSTALLRSLQLCRDFWGDAALILVCFFLIGLVTGGSELKLSLAQVAMLFLGYAFYAHPLAWNVYYFEALPVLCLTVSLGLAATLRLIGAKRPRRLVTVIAMVVLVAGLLPQGINAMTDMPGRLEPQLELETALRSLGNAPAIVAVHRKSNHSPHVQLVDYRHTIRKPQLLLVHELPEVVDSLAAELATHAVMVYDEASGEICVRARRAVSLPATIRSCWDVPMK